MDEKNPFVPNTYEWHNHEIKTANNEEFGLVWIMNEFFYDYTLARPKAFPKKEAHLYAVMYILSSVKDEFVFVEDAASYHRKKYFPNRS